MAPALQQLEAMGLKNPAWLKQQSPQNWTLQVLGARDPETLIKFARQHKLGDDSAWFVTDLNGKPWYVLVHRFYANRDIARNAISRLPVKLRQARPWVKSLQAIHKSMRCCTPRIIRSNRFSKQFDPDDCSASLPQRPENTNMCAVI